MSVINEPYIYEMDDESPSSRCLRTKLQSEEDNYGLGQRCTIQIPNTHNSVLNGANSWFDISVSYSNLTSTGSTALANLNMSNIGIYSAISEILVEQGQNLLQHTRNHQEIMSMLLTGNTDEASILPLSATAGVGDLTAKRERLGRVVSAAGGAVAKQNFSVQLIGLLSSVKKLPLFQLNSPLRITLVWANNVNQMLYSALGSAATALTGGDATFTCQYNADIVMLSDRAVQDIKNASNINSSGILSYTDSAIECVKTNISVAEQNSVSETVKVQIQGGLKPKKLLSCAVYGVPLPNGNCDAYQTFNYGSKSFQLRLGNKLHPPRAYENLGQTTNGFIQTFGQNSLTMYSNNISHEYNKLSQRQSASTATVAEVAFGVVGGHSFKSWYDSRDGIDSSNKQLETMVSLKKPTATATLDITSCFVKRYAIIVSCSEDGQMSIAY